MEEIELEYINSPVKNITIHRLFLIQHVVREQKAGEVLPEGKYKNMKIFNTHTQRYTHTYTDI